MMGGAASSVSPTSSTRPSCRHSRQARPPYRELAGRRAPVGRRDSQRLAPRDPSIAENLKYLIAKIAAEGAIVRTRTTGSWRSDRFLYAPWEDWVRSPLLAVDEESTRSRTHGRNIRNGRPWRLTPAMPLRFRPTQPSLSGSNPDWLRTPRTSHQSTNDSYHQIWTTNAHPAERARSAVLAWEWPVIG